MDTHSDEEFDRITHLAASYFNAPAFFTVIDRNGGWIKSRSGHGFHPGAEQLLVHSLAFLRQEIMLVPDLSSDARFASHSAVAGAHPLRFHASVAVHSPDRTIIGALALLDVTPRTLSSEQAERLSDFGKLIDGVIAASHSRQRLIEQDDTERSMRELMDCLPEGVLMLSEDGTVVSCNAVAEKMYGSPRHGLVGLSSLSITADDPERLSQLLQAGVVDQIQAAARRVDGSEFPVEYSIKILDATSTRRYALIVRDISLRKEEERRARIADARRRNYFVTATHELRTPMASIFGFSELLVKRHFEPAEGRQLIEIVHRQAARLVSLINEMLDLARIEYGGQEGLDMQVVNASTILEATLSGLSGLGADHRIRSVSGANLPALKADAGKLQQALTNIISNAVKYSDSSTEIVIELFEASMHGRVAIGFRVADQGIGMTLDEQRQIYKPFFRARGAADATGTGLGMTIFKEIIDLHGGLVEIASNPGSGTTVTFVLPALPQ